MPEGLLALIVCLTGVVVGLIVVAHLLTRDNY